MLRGARVHAAALAAYAIVALVANWPLPRHLGSALTGAISGDTGVYVWNVWLFRHEILAHGRFPLFTAEILSLTPPVDLSLHNYTLFADLLAFPLLPALGVVATFNVVYLFIVTLTAWAMFVLARAVIRRDGEAWLAGALFGFSPVLMARSTAHFSLVAAAPLPLFICALIRAERRCDLRFVALAGAIVAWASMCDAYYGVFCVVIAAFYLGSRRVRLHAAAPVAHVTTIRALDLMIVTVLGLTVGIALTGGTDVRVGPYSLGLRTLYTPVLAATVLFLARFWAGRRQEIVLKPPPIKAALRFAAVAAIASVLPLSPVLYALGHRLRDGGALHGPIYWRSSPPGVDLAAFFMPNPNQPLFGGPWRLWLDAQPGRYAENVASFSIVGLLVVVVALLRYRFKFPRVWLALLVCFTALALGPFIRVGGFNTFVPGPWALLRYLPIVGATRTPARYAVVAMMAFAVVFGRALAHIADAQPARRRTVLAIVGCAMAFELVPAPRPLYPARYPDIYRRIAEDPRDVRVLELPFGIRDGERSAGNFTAASQFYQTLHEKQLVGGYLSRISRREFRRQEEFPTLLGLMRLSEGRPLPQSRAAQIEQNARSFPTRRRLGYVVIDRGRTPDALRTFVLQAFRLEKVGESGGLELYVPAVR